MIVKVSSLLQGTAIRGITLYPFVLLRNKKDKSDQVLINHERIHLRQQLELLILPFFILYCLEYLLRLIQYRNPQKAYRNISFEREAYAQESNMQYLNHRMFFSFLRYL